ncbi:hypothetical protein J4477_00605 [Candidatus Pacearchaeota archaeon]|nr:hypothetical protein [Candidatus Pacearchaeota archaeon]
MPEPKNQSSNPIFLREYSLLPWERPAPEGVILVSQLGIYSGSTCLKEFLGHDSFKTTTENFHIEASASKYLADIVRYDSQINPEDDNRLPEEELIFSGGILIYNRGIIPGTDIGGYNLDKMGKIWCGRKPSDLMKSSNGLNVLISGEGTKYDEVDGVIRKIIEGYRIQEDKSERARSRQEYNAFSEGREFNEERFGRVFGDLI